MFACREHGEELLFCTDRNDFDKQRASDYRRIVVMSFEILKNHIWKEIERQSIDKKIMDGEHVSLKGLPGSLRTLFISLVAEHVGRPVLVILPSREEVEDLTEDLVTLRGDEGVAFFPGGEEDPESPMILNPRRAGLQMKVVRDLLLGTLKIVIVSPEGILQKLPPSHALRASCVQIMEGAQFDLFALVEKLVDFGYNRESMVERPGEISLRGGILDVFPFTEEEPHRVEFLGDRIESVRIFNADTQVSKSRGESLVLLPSPLAWKDRSVSLFSYFPKGILVLWQDPDMILARADEWMHKGKWLGFGSHELKKHIQTCQTISLYTLSSSKDTRDFGGREIHRLGRRASEIRENLASICDTHQDVFLVCQRENQCARIQEFLELDRDPMPKLQVLTGPIRQGFHLTSSRLAVYTDGDLFGHARTRQRWGRFRTGVPIWELSSLKKGDFVVHVDYGIGKYQGLEKVTVRDSERECLVLLYQDGDKLFVPVDKMERVQKYGGREGVQPNLSKLGSSNWEKIKSRTKKSIKNIARDLISLYSFRQALPGFSFSPDTTWQNELEATFIYEETPDQTRAIEEVKRDMERLRPMDRLVCGDVGYGKTEVAVRAAFKAVSDGKQVAVLVPTTILAQQHFQTFQRRLSQFPVLVEVLSRFQNRKEQKKIVERLKKGEIDIVIGTHRLLSNDIGFKDLGLLIIDEEHRFGVRHKEKLKTFRKTVDVLALSATPIPRTLHISLMGIRDMSIMNTPPRDRLSIITEVIPFNQQIIQEAIYQELSRGGQIFFVHNRIKSIHAVARMIRRIVPTLRLAVAHGRMEGNALERVMFEFIERKYDCLVATMIIGSGLDMPNVNTIIINRADQLGLSQLYQLRGRVGRSDKRAYAYLLVPPFHLLTSEAVKRLRTIEEFTELGSGFQIALRDLEIRGAGNLLGVEQSGIMDAVGFDLYMRLVDEAVHELKQEIEKGEKVEHSEMECSVDVDLAAFLPVFYVPDESIRINLYHRLSSFRRLSDVDAFSIELQDRFGELPSEARHLLDVARLRLLGIKKGVKRIFLEGSVLRILFDEGWVDSFPSPELLNQHIKKIIKRSPVPVRFSQDKTFGLRLSIPEDDTISFTKKLLQSWE